MVTVEGGMPFEYHFEMFSVGQDMVKAESGVEGYVCTCGCAQHHSYSKKLKIRVSSTHLTHLILKVFHETTRTWYTFSTFPTTKNIYVFLIVIFCYQLFTSFHLWEN